MILRRLLLSFALVGALLLSTAPAGAQDDPGAPEDSSDADDGADGSTDDGPTIPLDFSDVLTTEPGSNTPRVNQDTDIEPVDPAAPNLVEPDAPVAEETPTEAPEEELSDEVIPIDSSGGGRPLLPMVLALFGILVIVAGLIYWRRQQAVSVDDGQLEQPLPAENMEGNELLDMPKQYAGANDAGAYQQGGAAYAQYMEASYSAATTMTADSSASRLAAMRAALANAADRQLEAIGKRGMIEARLERAAVKVTPGEWAVAAAGAVLGGMVVGLVVFGSVVFAVGFAVFAGFASWSWIGRKIKKREKAFATQLPETLGLLASSLRGGMSMMQSFNTIAAEADSPSKDEFIRIVTEIRLGRDMGAAFKDLATRMNSKDFEWVVTAIDIHREVGGDLASILDRVANTIRARNRVLGQMKALSAEGRMSGYVLFGLPPAMVLLISVMNRGYLDEMIGSTIGIGLLIVAAVMLAIGGFWMKHLVKFRY